MALVQLSDVIIPEVYQTYDAVNSPELTAFFQSGVAVRTPLIDQLANGGKEVHIPFWKDIDATIEPNYSTDDPNDVAAPEKIQAGEMRARVAQMNHALSAADLVTELAGSDPMRRIRDRFGVYWTRQFQRRIIACAKGILADNIANDSGDMVNDISINAAGAPTDAALFSRSAFTKAVFTLGDAFGEISAIAVHSTVYQRMVDNDDIEFILPTTPDPNLPLEAQRAPHYMGKPVIVDDGMPKVSAGNSGFIYTSVLFGQGAIGYGEGNPRVPVEVFRIPSQGNGGGIEQLWERKTWIVHPFGYKFDSEAGGGIAGQSPTIAELAAATHWNRMVERKNVPLAFLKTNG